MTDKLVKLTRMRRSGGALVTTRIVPEHVVSLEGGQRDEYTLCFVEMVTGKIVDAVGTCEEIAKALGMEDESDDR